MSLRVSVAVALPDRQEVIELELPDASRVGDAIEAAQLPQRFPTLDFATARLGIWSKTCPPDTPLRDGDRVEVYRPLTIDPKQARRARATRKR